MMGIVSSGVELGLMVFEPAYRTHKELQNAIVRGGSGNRNDATSAAERQRRLMVHWIVYGAFRAFDWIAASTLPCYDVVKVVLIVWLRLGGGSETVYRSLIGPFLASNEPVADQWLIDRAADAKNIASKVKEAAVAAATADDRDQ